MASLNAFSTGGSASPGRFREKVDSLSVVVAPQELQFMESDRNSHSRVLTIYNLYSFRIQYEVSCTAPDHYRVQEASGSIKAKCSVDLIVRYQTASASHGPLVRDKFRINIFRDKTLIGHRTIPSTLVRSVSGGDTAAKEDSPTSNGHAHNLRKEGNTAAVARASGGGISPGVLLLLVVILLVAIIVTPFEGHNSPHVPPWFCMTGVQKVCAAFFLGMVFSGLFAMAIAKRL